MLCYYGERDDFPTTVENAATDFKTLLCGKTGTVVLKPSWFEKNKLMPVLLESVKKEMADNILPNVKKVHRNQIPSKANIMGSIGVS